MKIKTTIRYHLLEWLLSKRQERTSVDEDMEKWEPSCSVGGNENWYSHLENNMEIPQKIKIKLAYDPATAFLGIYAKKH